MLLTLPLISMFQCLSRIENLSHILFWKKITETKGKSADKVDVVELPRLRLTLTEKNGRLFSVDHADLCICDEPYLDHRPELIQLTAGMYHSC